LEIHAFRRTKAHIALERSLAALRQAWDDNFVVLDVRPNNGFHWGRFPSAHCGQRPPLLAFLLKLEVRLAADAFPAGRPRAAMARDFARHRQSRYVLGMEHQVKGKDLTKAAPRSPNQMMGGYVILGRTLDKCRALLGGNIGPYHFNCPLDNMLFGWKRIVGDDFKKAVAEGRNDEEMVQGVDQHGRKRTPEEKKKWI